MKNQFIAIEDVLNVFDNNRLWYYIPGFNGYEVSNDCYLRSMKHYRRYPYGILIQPVKRKPYGDSCDPLYELSDDNNIRRRIRMSQIVHLSATNQFAVGGYPRRTIITDTQSRNKFVKNKDGDYCKVYNGNRGGGGKNSYTIPPLDNTVKYPLFNIIQDGTEFPNMEYIGPQVRVPIVPLRGDGEYYGRKDCRTRCGLDVQARPSEIFNRG